MKTGFSRKKLSIVMMGVSIIALFTACTEPESEGKKLGQQACDCQKEYVAIQNQIYQEYPNKFNSYGFKTRTEARQKLQNLQDDAKKQFEQCRAKVEQNVKEARSKFPTSNDDLFDPNYLQKAMQNPQKYAKELAKNQEKFAKNQEKARAFENAYRNTIKECTVHEVNKNELAIEAKILTIIPEKPTLAKLKQDLVGRRIIEQANGYYGRGWYWQISSPDELKSVVIQKGEKVDDDYVLDVHLLLQKDVNQHEADLKITCVLQQNDDWTIDFIETKDIRIVKTGRYNNCISTEIKKGWGTSLEFTNNCDVNLIVGGEMQGNDGEWIKFSCKVNANSTGSVSYHGKEYKIDFIERQ
jgi:hypothetical protein